MTLHQDSTCLGPVTLILMMIRSDQMIIDHDDNDDDDDEDEDHQ